MFFGFLTDLFSLHISYCSRGDNTINISQRVIRPHDYIILLLFLFQSAMLDNVEVDVIVSKEVVTIEDQEEGEEEEEEVKGRHFKNQQKQSSSSNPLKRPHGNSDQLSRKKAVGNRSISDSDNIVRFDYAAGELEALKEQKLEEIRRWRARFLNIPYLGSKELKALQNNFTAV
jgi:hypothetical protein